MTENHANDEASDSLQHYVVGIGASAGGLEAIEELFEHMPLDTGMSFIIIQHLSPDHKSLMKELLSRKTRIPIRIATNGMTVEPDNIYLLPPKHEMMISSGTLLLKENEGSRHLCFPINNFFYSLGDSYEHRAIAVVLSGTGSDGAKGIVSVHDAGGFTIAQEPSSCSFASMPKNAIVTQKIDMTLAPKEIPENLIRYSKRTIKFQNQIDLSDMTEEEGRFSEIILVLKNRFGLDFSKYKPSTITRRIERRINMHKLSGLQEYLNILLSDSEELENLYFDLLIGVTEFFRDRDFFAIIKEHLKDLVEDFTQDDEIRVWVAGCATGQEAFSLSILFYEYMRQCSSPRKYKIFATDIHKRSIARATLGTFRDDELKGLDADLIETYFAKIGSQFQIIPEIRKSIVFAQHNVIQDPPFTKIHIVSCRNLMIYLNQRTQKRVLGLLAFSLKPRGYLFLGPSESIGKLSPYFRVIDETAKIYQKTANSGRIPLLESYQKSPDMTSYLPAKESYLMGTGGPNTSIKSKKAIEILLQEYVPPSLLIDSGGNVLRIFGNAKDFLTFEAGIPSTNVRSMVGNSAKVMLSQMISSVLKDGKAIRTNGVGELGSYENVDIEVGPLSAANADSGYLLIKFFEQRSDHHEDQAILIRNLDPSTKIPDHVSELEEELRYTKESLQTTVEELETSNEELQASNEELQASNEELQSTNEELQSLNEELYTLNAEYQVKERERAELIADEKNILNITEVGVLLLDSDMNIRKFSPVAGRIFGLIDGDEGRLFQPLALKDGDKLTKWVNDCLLLEKSFDELIHTHDGSTFTVKVVPYRPHGSRVKSSGQGSTYGVTLSLSDITARHALEQTLVKSDERYQDVINSVADGFFEWKKNQDGLFLQQTFKSQLGYSFDDQVTLSLLLMMEAGNFLDLINAESNRSGIFAVPLKIYKKDRSTTWMLCRGKISDNKVNGIFIDINKMKLEEASLKANTQELERSNRLLEEFAFIVSHDLKAPLRHIRNYITLLKEAIEAKDVQQADNELQRLQASSFRLENLLDDIITLSRFSSEKKKLERVDLKPIMQEVIETLEPQIRERNVLLEVSDLPQVLGDKTLLSHLFQNLIGNACKYNDKPQPRIKVTSHSDDNYELLTIEDNGIGFRSEQSDMIFSPFKRLVTHDKYEGSGIGLSICKTIVEQHHGMISAQGERGKGATFTIKLPK